MGAMLGVGAFLPLQFCTSPKTEEGAVADLATPKSKLDSFGIQLYSVKEDMATDAQATIRSLAGYGYKQLEGFDGGKGILWGMQPAEFKTLLAETGTTMVASHANVYENLDAQAARGLERDLAAAELLDQVQRDVRRGVDPAAADHVAAIGDEVFLAPVRLREMLRVKLGEPPVGGGALAVEQARRRGEQRARAGGDHGRAVRVPLP